MIKKTNNLQISKLIYSVSNLINSTRNNPHRQTVAVNQTDVVPRVLGRRLRREVELDFGVGRRLAAEGRTRRRRLAELAVVAGIGAVDLRPESSGPSVVRDLNLKCALLSFKCVCPKFKKKTRGVNFMWLITCGQTYLISISERWHLIALRGFLTVLGNWFH